MEQIPKHIAIIPDGNRRWAKAQGIPDSAGHAEGVGAATEIFEYLQGLGVEYVTLWSASLDNLRKRSKMEISGLCRLMANYLSEHIEKQTFQKHESRFLLLGQWQDELSDPQIEKLSTQLMEQTKHFTKRTLTILFGYDGREEMLSAVRDLQKTGEEITAESLHAALWTGMLPSVDLVVRTGGEPHNSSGFLMWHTADSMLYFTPTLWPDFGKEELAEVLTKYSQTERRFGK